MTRLVSGVLVRLMRLVTGVRIRWARNLPPTGPRIYVANHSSHIDGLVVWAALPPEERARAHPVAASDYWAGSRFKRYLARDVFGAVFVSRGAADRDTIPKLTSVLDRGDALILFPEGTRGDGETVRRFRSGLYHLVHARPEAEVVPVRLENLARSLPKGRVVPVPILGRATFGEPFTGGFGTPLA
ncbi:MAG TPA: 1-acyl-sn-glycerol-3-phosphate acyltransferase, partial [Bacteroidetes bacterium]|nr:1-acyl-sn-glycerol-3-phosphate acyltransferase [Bacteroidota bacterium]